MTRSVRGGGATLLGALAVLAIAGRAAAAQSSAVRHWAPLGGDSNVSAWMDSTRFTAEDGGFPGGWYKVRAVHETKFTVVRYAVDCPHFSLSIRRSTTYDGSGAVIIDDRVARPFRPPVFFEPLQRFMHVVCRLAKNK
jgi:hypothetical protein